MAEKTDKGIIILRRKMSVSANKTTAIPIDVIEIWGDKAPRAVYFTVFQNDDKFTVTIEPAIDEPTRQATMQELLIPGVEEKK
jgi:hypothetical protein